MVIHFISKKKGCQIKFLVLLLLLFDFGVFLAIPPFRKTSKPFLYIVILNFLDLMVSLWKLFLKWGKKLAGNSGHTHGF